MRIKKVCGDISVLFRFLRDVLTSTTNKTPHAIETSLLCTSQIACCIKYLEKALTIEMNNKIVLTVSGTNGLSSYSFYIFSFLQIKPTRQFFLDRIMWCLSRIKSLNDSTITPDTNFVHLMDVALELVAPLTLFAAENNTSNIAKYRAEVGA